MLNSGSLLLTRSPIGPVRSVRTSGTIPTVSPIQADVRLDCVDGSPNPPAPVPRQTWTYMLMRFQYQSIFRATVQEAQGFSPTPTAPLCLPSRMLRGIAPCSESFEVLVRYLGHSMVYRATACFVRHMNDALRKAVRACIRHYPHCSL